MEQTMIKVTINGETREYPKMTPYSEIVKDYEGETEYPVILVTENGKLRELHKKLPQRTVPAVKPTGEVRSLSF